jgi:hypothetical protein
VHIGFHNFHAGAALKPEANKIAEMDVSASASEIWSAEALRGLSLSFL